MDDLRKSSKLQIGLMSVIFVSLMIVVPITGYFHDLGGSSQFKSGSATYNQTNRTFTANFDGLFLKTVATFIDPTTYAFKIHIEVEPSGSFKTSDDLERLAEPIRLFVNGRPTIFPAGQPTSPQDLSLTFSTGDPNRYPFESFGDSVRIHAQRDVSSTLSTPIPLALSFTGYLQGWSITSTAENVGLRDVKLQIQFARSATVKFFSLFVIGLMWILSLTMLTLSVTLWIRKRRVEPPTMAVAAALLFALPAIRNTQPGIPVIGCLADATGFLFNMALLSISVLLLLWNYILKYKKEKCNLKGKRQESVYIDIGDSLDTLTSVTISSPTTVRKTEMPHLSSLFIPKE